MDETHFRILRTKARLFVYEADALTIQMLPLSIHIIHFITQVMHALATAGEDRRYA